MKSSVKVKNPEIGYCPSNDIYHQENKSILGKGRGVCICGSFTGMPTFGSPDIPQKNKKSLFRSPNELQIWKYELTKFFPQKEKLVLMLKLLQMIIFNNVTLDI